MNTVYDLKFEKISKYADDENVIIPTRATLGSAGYDFYAAEDTIIPPHTETLTSMITLDTTPADTFYSMEDMAAFTKLYRLRPTLVPTGIKCKIPEGCYLQLAARSSLPLKHWLILANGVGIIDGDYYNNPDNEGHIYFQLINLSPFPIEIKKGECFGQGIIVPFVVSGDELTRTAERTGGFGSTSV